MQALVNMDPEHKVTFPILLTQSLLVVTSMFFLGLSLLAFAWGESPYWSAFYGLVLGVLPIVAVVGINKQTAWGRGSALISLLVLFAFVLRFLWSIWATLDIPISQLAQLFLMFLSIPLAIVVLIPYLLFKLTFGRREAFFFAEATSLGSLPDGLLEDSRGAVACFEAARHAPPRSQSHPVPKPNTPGHKAHTIH